MPEKAMTLADIGSADWSLALDSTEGGASGAGIGSVVQGLGDVDQCIRIILTTPRGSDPLRPTFGCDLWSYIDFPVNLARASIVREAAQAIAHWEPRVRLLSVTVSPVLDSSAQSGAHLTVTATWELALGGAVPQNTTVTIPGAM